MTTRLETHPSLKYPNLFQILFLITYYLCLHNYIYIILTRRQLVFISIDFYSVVDSILQMSCVFVFS